MSTATQHETDVPVVEASPTGPTLACELLRRGVRCRIVDKAPHLRPLPASWASSRALELFYATPSATRCSAGSPVVDSNLYDGDRLLLIISTAKVKELDTLYQRRTFTASSARRA